MKTLYRNLRSIPGDGFTFTRLYDFMFQEGERECKIGNNTTAQIIDPMYLTPDESIRVGVSLHQTMIAVLHESGDSVRIYRGSHKTNTTKDRIDKCLLPLGYRLTSVRGTWKVYSINTGRYRDFFEGMNITRGEF